MGPDHALNRLRAKLTCQTSQNMYSICIASGLICLFREISSRVVSPGISPRLQQECHIDDVNDGVGLNLL